MIKAADFAAWGRGLGPFNVVTNSKDEEEFDYMFCIEFCVLWIRNVVSMKDWRN